MLATVLKSRRATEATFAIIETFAIAWRRGFQPRHNAPQLTDKLVASSRLHAAYQ